LNLTFKVFRRAQSVAHFFFEIINRASGQSFFMPMCTATLSTTRNQMQTVVDRPFVIINVQCNISTAITGDDSEYQLENNSVIVHTLTMPDGFVGIVENSGLNIVCVNGDLLNGRFSTIGGTGGLLLIRVGSQEYIRN